jgi:hypothetical protein
MPTNEEKKELINSLMKDVTGEEITLHRDDITNTISNILHEYNLNTDLSFIERMAKLKIPGTKDGHLDLAELPSELRDAAFLPVNTIADISLRQDLDLIISQIPEWFTALQITRDAICESDVVDGTMARDIKFNRSKLSELEQENIISKIEEVEDRLELHSIIKNHIVFNTLEYGEGYIYAIPYAKVFQDLYKYRLSGHDKNSRNSTTTLDMTETSSVLNGYGFGESAVEISLNDTIVNDSSSNSKKKKGKSGIFTEAEIIEINPMYRTKVFNEDGSENKKASEEIDSEIDATLEYVSRNIRYIEKDIALPVIEESAHDLRAVYNTKYHDQDGFVQEVDNLFERVMNDSIYMEDGENPDAEVDNNFDNIKGIYLKILPATKLIPIRVDRNIIGYYYISDLTRPEETGQRRNSGLTGYTLRSPSVGFDTFSPDRMFCEKLASKIINNFNMKFMKDNLALHQQIVSILQSHKFNEAMMRFVFIPAEHVIQCSINKDGIGKGHSMLEPGLVTARMYMFLKLYSILYQINNSTVRVYNLRMSGLDKDYQKMVNDTMRKFAARRVTVNDIFNYRSSMTKVSGFSELVMPMGAGDQAPITFDSIPAAEAPINNELLEQLKNESINATPVPSLMVQTGGESQIEFAKETELANTRFNTMISSYKIDFNHDITKLYRRILRWETDIEPDVLKDLKYVLRMPTSKTLNVTVEMINNFNALLEVALQIFLKDDEVQQNDKPTETARQFKKLLLHEYIPQIDIDHFDELVAQARAKANEDKMAQTGKGENIIDSGLEDEEGGI